VGVTVRAAEEEGDEPLEAVEDGDREVEEVGSAFKAAELK
jgi:hypothetical protein